ncbi:GH1 family beta-glucosidase [Alicyclobacillus tolerans]|uniref:Beta-glucosidase n=1 Tax=Alicyclobacillus tolerans TaxID=90970 RepID=A0A1M6QLL0_9BACL|nr:GH1 family beta-glucosidase [Alicyclobacillus montanus]SHK21154.1 broad-specificity cellobiase [Alicyclobacillus montanus]
MTKNWNFPGDFLFGVATSAYQIEGASREDGRTLSHWDTFCYDGKTYQGHNGDIACDHYHRFPEDIALMADLGVQAYRFSFAWPRIFPEKGKLNMRGIEFYHRLLDELEKHHIEPVGTIYHWDLPAWLAEEGGWLERNVIDHFREFSETLFKHFGKRISKWITHNEPWCASFLSYGIGEHAPGHQNWQEAVMAAHHILLSHGEAVKAYRQLGMDGQIGITLNLNVCYPASESPEDKQAAMLADGFSNRWFLDPIFHGYYPEDMLEAFQTHVSDWDFLKDGDVETIAVPIDFLGVNFYSRSVVRHFSDNPFLQVEQVPAHPDVCTAMGWEIHPESLYRLLTRLASEYTSIPIYITENGAAFDDVMVDGKVSDPARIDYLEGHLRAAERFCSENKQLKGYFLWSLLDNFEWAHGYSKRFGIVHVDFATQRRTLKESGEWYKKLVHMHRQLTHVE